MLKYFREMQLLGVRKSFTFQDPIHLCYWKPLLFLFHFLKSHLLHISFVS